ncbi:hypothetical protein EHP00_124 [Ecytonucleospora hepatopenaei]|uniref:Phospholipid/glycerol acyltransferase domain-containing protein n=1 Tax=Ecytonucleospora hepatopenaei TaxID=646526 RepID=A0A1W0E5U5_9MICR|nr:hypothetical protein EHP00_124 [Ecytonucleospora hepatopenaei]
MKNIWLLRIPLLIFSLLGGFLNICMLWIAYKLLGFIPFYKKRKAYKALKFYGYHVMISYMSLFFTRAFYFHGNVKKLKARKSISIFNHCSDFDWLFIIVIYYKLNMFENLFFLMKKELGKIPVFGYLIQQNGHLLISRSDKNSDICEIQRYVKKYNKTNEKFSIFIFPEGTYLHKKSIKKTLEFAEKTNLTIKNEEYRPTHTLIPRVTGFNTVQNDLNAKCIYNGLILNNPYFKIFEEVQGNLSYLLCEKVPLQPVILLDAISIHRINENFMYECFYEKEKTIKKYIENIDGKNILSKEELEQILKNIGVIKKHSCLSKTYVKSKYQIQIFLFTTLVQFLLLFFIRKCINK